MQDFSAGLNTDQHEVLLEPNEATEILNFRLNKVGSLVSRDGLQPVLVSDDILASVMEPLQYNGEDVLYNGELVMYEVDVSGGGFSPGFDEGFDIQSGGVPGEVPLPGPITQLGAWRNSTNLPQSQVLFHSGTQLYKVDQTLGEYVSIYSGLAVNRGTFLNAQDRAIYSNGAGRPVMWDGTTAVELGIDEPPAFATATATSGGSVLDGDYSYVYTYVDSLGRESNPSPISTVSPAPTNQTVTLTWDDPEDLTTHVRIYRRDDVSGSAAFIYLAEVAVGTETYADDGLVSLNPFVGTPPVDHNPPPNLERMAYYNGTYFGSIGKELYWSLPYQPDYWPGQNVTELPFEGNDRVVTMVSQQDTLLVFGRTNLLLVQGLYPNFSVSRLDVAIGAVSMDSAIEVEGSTFFLSDDGIRVFPGMELLTPRVRTQFTSLTNQEKEAGILSYSPGERSLWASVGGRTFVFHLPTQSTTIYDFSPNAVLSGGATGTEPPILSTGMGTVLSRYAGGSDRSLPIPIAWTSKLFQLDNPESTKFIRRLGMFASQGAEANVTIQLADSNNIYSVVPSSQNVNQGTIFWDGGALWEDDSNPLTNPLWSDPSAIVYFIGSLPAQTLVGMTLRVLITGQTSERVEIVPPVSLLYRESLRFLGA